MIWRFQSGKWQKAAFHNTAKGMTAMIVCNGPSLNGVDVSKLAGAGRVVIGVNSSYPKVRPDYWIGMDRPDNYDSGLWAELFPKILRSGSHNRLAIESHRGFPGVHFMDFDTEGADIFGPMDGGPFVWQQNTFCVAVQFAIHLGCTSLVFVGCDLDNSKAHYADGNYLTEAQRHYNECLYNAQFEWLKKFAIEADKRGVSCFSLSDSRINSFMPKWDANKVATKYRTRLHCADPSGQECNEFAAHQKRGGRQYSLGHRAMYLTAVEMLRGSKSSVIEVGVGIGYGLGELIKADCISSFWGCEPCKDSFDFTSGVFANTEADVTLALGSWSEHLHCAEEADFSFCIEVIEHLHEHERTPMLKMLRTKTRKALFLSTPDADISTHGVYNQKQMLHALKETGWEAVAVKVQWTTFYLATPVNH